MQPINQVLRRYLDTLYRYCGFIAGGFLVLLLCIIVMQMVARWIGWVFPGATHYAGYCMASSTFFALAYTLNYGAHIRVKLLLACLGDARRSGEFWCLVIGSTIATYFAYHAVSATFWSWKLHDISQGQDAWPLWIPQLSMSIGTIVFAITLIDRCLYTLLYGIPPDKT